MIKRILLVDDSPISRKTLRSCIPKDQEYEFYEAGDGEVAIEKFMEVRPDVTFLDIAMPVMDGIRCLEELVKIDENAIIIMYTANIQPKSILRVNALGALTVVRKPPSKDTVKMALLKAEERLKETASTRSDE
jgi:two-component system, chemotaxis family, chemotaxis protein CheY